MGVIAGVMDGCCERSSLQPFHSGVVQRSMFPTNDAWYGRWLLDQAHNLEDCAREAASAKLSLRALFIAAGEMHRLGLKCELPLITRYAMWLSRHPM